MRSLTCAAPLVGWSLVPSPPELSDRPAVRPCHAGGIDGAPNTIERLVGVYDADGTVAGEVAYWIGARLGRAHCSLCDITHGLAREKADWKACRAGLAVPFDTYHRNDQPDAVRRAAGTVPVVVAETSTGIVPLVGPDELDACAGSVDALAAAVERAVEAAGLGWP